MPRHDPGSACVSRPVGAIGALSATVLLLLGATPVAAQEYPSKPVTIVVPFAPGGGTDQVARLLAGDLEKSLRQSIVIENKPGASGAVGASYTLSQAADGHTLLLLPVGAVSVLPVVEPNLSYDPVRDFAAVTNVFSTNLLIDARADFPAKDLKELVAMAKASPGKLNYGHSGNFGMPHIGMELFKGVAGVDIVAVPYRSETPQTAALLGGEIGLGTMVYAGISGHVKEGKIKILAQLGEKRSPQMPNIPTAVEAGYPGVVGMSWVGMFVPIKTPAPVIDKVSKAVAAALKVPAIRDRMISQDQIPIGSTPAEFSAFVLAENAKWRKVIDDRNLKSLPK